MSKGIDYFAKVGDQVPNQVQKMQDDTPSVLNHYTNIRRQIMEEGPLLF